MGLTAAEAKFASRYAAVPWSGCWIWLGHEHRFGYGRFHVGDKNVLAHRFSYERFVSPIPDGMLVLHRCDVPACVNPAHLFLGDSTDNARDCSSKGRFAQQKKTHCLRGHLYDPENTCIMKGGRRNCRTCKREKDSRQYRTEKLAAIAARKEQTT